MMQPAVLIPKNISQLAVSLNEAVSQNDQKKINKLIFELTSLRESAIYQELETLTREIHDSINAFANDNQLAELAQEGIPDARERLNYIITKTDEAAHRTLNGAEKTVSIVESMVHPLRSLLQCWDLFRNHKLSEQQTERLHQEVSIFLLAVDKESQNINTEMTDIMLAQDYQDITGQMIKQVLSMVKEIEDKLLKLVAMAGASPFLSEKKQSSKDGEKAVGPQLPGESNDIARSQSDVDDVLDSLGI